MKKYGFVFSFLAVFGVAACNSSPKALKINDDEKQAYLAIGDSISAVAQKTLMKNVSQAIKQQGIVGAIDFCNVQAMTLTDSLSKQYRASIQRKSDKNRNPANAIETDFDKAAWQKLKSLVADKSVLEKQFVEKTNEGTFYYKAITLAMPTCLSCHGKPGVAISAEAMAAIKQKYPTDKAVGYEMGDLRGMWKLKLD